MQLKVVPPRGLPSMRTSWRLSYFTSQPRGWRLLCFGRTETLKLPDVPSSQSAHRLYPLENILFVIRIPVEHRIGRIERVDLPVQPDLSK